MDADNPRMDVFFGWKGRRPGHRRRTLQGHWMAGCQYQASITDFSAVGYQYAKILQEKLKVPVGVIMTTWGGTVIEAWMDRQSLASFPGIKVLNTDDTAKIFKNEPTVLYNAMVQLLVGYGIKRRHLVPG